jgi:mono/diheme cytochrome c family protein
MNRIHITDEPLLCSGSAIGTALLLRLLVVAGLVGMLATASSEDSPLPSQVRTLLQAYCVDCHGGDQTKGGFDLLRIQQAGVARHANEWERVVRKLQARQMPPAGKERPTEQAYQNVVAYLVSTLDRAAQKHPDPGRSDTFRRLSRTEYQNAVRDLLALDMDATALLPKDDSGHGFDNQALGNLSATLLNRYLSAAEKISRLAIGAPRRTPGGDTYRTPPDLTQEEHVEGLPFGTRGGMLIAHTFPRDGEYEIQIRLARDRNEHVEGMREQHQLEILLDGKLVAHFTVSPPKDENHDQVDAHLKVRVTVPAGPRRVGVTFRKNHSSLQETKRQPYQARYNMHRHPRLGPAVYQVSINGPYHTTGAGDTPSRRRIFIIRPAGAGDEDRCAQQVIANLTRRAYRRPVSEVDLAGPLEFYRQAKAADGFEAGIEAALAAILVSPQFLFRMERDPAHVAPGVAYRLSDIALASRLSFFLWSSIPDDELLAVAERGELHRPKVLEKQTRRMLADPRAENLVGNFAEQWLHLRNLESVTPDLRLFPDFDDNLRQAFRRETELHFESMLRDDRSVLDLLRADYTFLNERLAKHYGIPHVYGSQFRRVALKPAYQRGGLLRQGSVLTVTSYATRTSPVIRGKWILENILGTPPPPPPGNVPALKEKTISEALPVRQRLAEHRANVACAGCHALIDPPGFALENYDAIGRWRTLEDGQPVDASGGLPDGSKFTGAGDLEKGLLQRPELFVGAFAEKLMTFALGRGVEPQDAPAIRKIVRDARADNYRLSAIVRGVVGSTPFQLRKVP